MPSAAPARPAGKPILEEPHTASQQEGDPHSPWRYGTSPSAVARGFWHSHVGWMLGRDRTNRARSAPDLLADPDLRRVDRFFPLRIAL
ncbi:MAG: hypothetical protein QOG20_5210 [Pseudonocardiales bacterium]|jgi:stearoyl-CoA desaturase (delta-9 desaturase)|nr:hypothetical protein [Pseudonocardiales bacterium]